MAGGSLSIAQSGARQAVRNLNAAALRVRRETHDAVERSTRIVERDVKDKGLTGVKGRHPLFGVTGASGDTLGTRSGFTRRSVTARVLDTGRTVTGVVGTPLKQMRMHEQGGTITGSQFLRIPTVNAQTGAGVDRYAGQSIRQIAGAFLFRSRAGNLWAAVRQGGQLVLLYLLKRTIRLRARHIFQRSLERTRPAIDAEMRRSVTTVVNVGNGKAT